MSYVSSALTTNMLSPCLSVCYSKVSFSSYVWPLTDEWLCLCNYPPPSCLCLCDVGLTRGGGSRVGTLRQMKGQKCVLRSFSSGSPSPLCARPTTAFHSNLMIMIFAQDDLCLHSVITPPAFYDLSYWKSMGHKRAPSELIIITARFSLQHDQI